MSDVEKALSGEHSDKHKTATHTLTAASANTTASPLKQQQHYSSKAALAANAYYCNETGNVVLTHKQPAPSYAGNCLSRLLKIVFSTPGLVLLVAMYSVMGALLFPLLEAPLDINKSAAIAKSREDCLRELWIITEKLNVLYERNWTMLVHEQLRRFEGSIVAASRSGSMGAVPGLSAAGVGTAIGRFGGSLDALEPARWSFSEALLYSVTVITTIGHGSLTPKTAAGKIATILYALIGVPLMLMCLSSLGALLAEALQCTYARICCRLARHASGRGGGSGDGKRQRRGSSSDDSLDERAKKPQGNAADAGCYAQANALDCKSCKYDDAMGETNLSNGYEYGDNGAASMQRCEDSSQLLHNSPAKITYNSPCMPLKSTTMAANEQYYQRTTAVAAAAAAATTTTHMQQQQQQQQQHPDVMLMATPAAARKMAQQQQQQQQQQQHCSNSRSPTPSPQHLPHHPLQTFHIVTSASANSSPTHPSLRQYATLQPQSQRQRQLQLPHQQHFVAVPSSMLRFQPAPAPATSTCAANVGANMPPNCYQPSSVAVTGAATIFFPLPTTAGMSSVSTESTVAPAQLLCSQPLVKYHTIHVQHGRRQSPASLHDAEDAALAGTMTAPLPPPPAYQTATVHGVRRAKFLTKPLPSEISTLLAETMAASSSSTATTNAACISTFAGATSGSEAVASAAALGSNTTVDIMEDEEENEQQRLGNCAHGTPSRVPLISGNGGGKSAGSTGAGDKEPERSARGLINATAASFHRHTLHTFQRGAGCRKSGSFAARRGCRMHTAGGGRAARLAHSGCYGDTTTETSDDEEEEYMQRGSEQLMLQQIDADAEAEADEDDELNSHAPQVPISIVLLILVCYICLGTVIFALWENWSLIDGAYFCFVTLATIGFGDFLPERTFRGPEVQLFACCAYLLLGLVLVAMSFSILETQLMWKCKRIAVRLKLAKD